MKKIISIIALAAFLFTMIASFANAAETLPAPYAKYTFDKASTMLKDSSGNKRDLIESPCEDANLLATVVDGKLVLSGATVLHADVVDGKDYSDNLTSFTYSIVAKRDVALGEGEEFVPISTGCSWDNVAGGFRITHTPDGFVGIDNRSTGTNWQYPLDVPAKFNGDAQWYMKEHRYTVTYDSKTEIMVLYIDNFEILNFKPLLYVPGSPLCPFTIGGMNDGGGWVGYGCKMTADNVVVFDQALTAAQVAEIDSVFAESSAQTSDSLIVGAIVLAATMAACLVICKKH